MRPQLSTAAVELAERQHGVVARRQLLALGVDADVLKRRVRNGVLRPVHRGVYAVGHAALGDAARWMAAVLACGAGGVLSHLSAARLWAMFSVPFDHAVHVTVSDVQRRHAGIVVHRASTTPADVTRHLGIPVTTVARTYVDVADVATYAALRRMADHGVRLDAAAIRRAQARAPNRRGRGRLARLIGDDVRTRSGLERQMRRLARGAGLPPPLVNHRVLGRERDFTWPQHRLVVEVDGGRYHAPRAAREADHERDAELVVAGWRVLRFTDTHVEHEPAAVTAVVRRALAG